MPFALYFGKLDTIYFTTTSIVYLFVPVLLLYITSVFRGEKLSGANVHVSQKPMLSKAYCVLYIPPVRSGV